MGVSLDCEYITTSGMPEVFVIHRNDKTAMTTG
jgi:hypothetical protein